ncbi:MAG: cytochrome c biogenesis protein CcsA [Chitinophagaceae bacterium]
MKYLNEHLLPGQLGHFLSILFLVAGLVATFSFFKAFKTEGSPEKASWLRLARVCFALETIAVVGMFTTLYYIISHHLFEYKYAWQHSSKALEVKYLLSCFWEGQEGSFMLWSFWHCVLGWVLIWRSKKWEAPVMFVISFAQVCLATMLIGIYFAGNKVGSSPFVLLRNELAAPIFSQPNYLSLIKDGQGLNALLQNYWMVIHPPVLFLGFASTIVPFSFAMAGFLSKDNIGWTTPALPWALFSGAILGLGIMMGAAWAYESLTFGGYWAWDPVENASLVPWFVLIAGIHTNLIFKSSGYSLRSTYVFYTVSFLLVLYSTFLTRSGVLGDTSVHAFTDLGMNVQLFLFLGIFAWYAPLVAAKTATHRLVYLGIFALLSTIGLWYPVFTLFSIVGGISVFIYQVNKQVPTIVKEENTYSREFWMFIGALIFFLSAIVVIVQTSLPVFNKMIPKRWNVAPPADPEFSYNQYQVFIALIIGLLTAVTQYLRYKDTPKNVFFSKILWPTIIAAALTVVVGFVEPNLYTKQGPVFHYALYLATFGAIYAVVANAGYIITGIKGKMKLAGASIAHIGFGLVLIGILISASNRTVLSYNKTGISPLKSTDKENSLENTTLIKGVQTDMGQYNVTYLRDTVNESNSKTYFELDFKSKTNDRQFKLYPDVISNNKGAEGLTPNPDAKHYFNRDIFTYVTYLTDPKKAGKDTSRFQDKTVAVGDTNFYSNGMWVLNKLEFSPANTRYNFAPTDTAFVADITVINKSGSLYKATPAYVLRNNQVDKMEDTVMSQSLVFRLNKLVDAQTKQVEISVKESGAILDFITLKVYEFPHINVLWLGILITLIGFVMSIVRRVGLMRKAENKY